VFGSAQLFAELVFWFALAAIAAAARGLIPAATFDGAVFAVVAAWLI
jgi:hypothetical protein